MSSVPPTASFLAKSCEGTDFRGGDNSELGKRNEELCGLCKRCLTPITGFANGVQGGGFLDLRKIVLYRVKLHDKYS